MPEIDGVSVSVSEHGGFRCLFDGEEDVESLKRRRRQFQQDWTSLQEIYNTHTTRLNATATQAVTHFIVTQHAKLNAADAAGAADAAADAAGAGADEDDEDEDDKYDHQKAQPQQPQPQPQQRQQHSREEVTVTTATTISNDGNNAEVDVDVVNMSMAVEEEDHPVEVRKKNKKSKTTKQPQHKKTIGSASPYKEVPTGLICTGQLQLSFLSCSLSSFFA